MCWLRRFAVYTTRFVSRATFVSAPVVARALPVASFNSSLINTRQFHQSWQLRAADEPFLNPKEVTDRVIEVVKNFEKVEAGKVSGAARFKEDLDLDSLDAVEIVMAIEEEFCIEIPDAEADKILSISDAVSYISNHPMAK